MDEKFENRKFLAHSKNKDGYEDSLSKHLSDVASKMLEFCCKPEYRHLFEVTGLLHDLGKYQRGFQKYLQGNKEKYPHASWGATLSKNLNHIEAAFAIDGHHKGMPDIKDLQSDINKIICESKKEFTENVVPAFLKEFNLTEEKLKKTGTGLSMLEMEILTRLVFSALTDADWLDTEEHFSPEITNKRQTHELNTEFLIEKLESEISTKSKDGELNILRNQVREYASSLAEMPVGFFSMALPTGMGKTLASVFWALRHAAKNKLKRIVIVLPYINIIDQTAKELKRIFGEEWVLEHHSSFNEDEEFNRDIANEAIQDEKMTKRLATENWDYPIIVTTTVQFFESLFSSKPSRCRKVHNIAQSVVIFDEVQTLPKVLVYPTITMLKNVHKVMETSFLFCTATMPAFEKRDGFDGIEKILSLVENPELIFSKTKRVEYFSLDDYTPISLDKLSEEVLKQNNSALCIFNTKEQARKFFQQMNSCSDYYVFHLSTAMCPSHRKKAINVIRYLLAKRKNKKIIVSSTQLIEAGVDFDFPCVFRELAPLESIIQSAGRCNRENKMQENGKVFLFSIQGAKSPPGEYEALSKFAKSIYDKKEEQLHDHNFFHEYYKNSLSLFFDEDKKKINNAREGFNFETVAGLYKLIDNKTTSLFVYNYNRKSNKLFKSICYKPALSRDDFRAMQQYTVQVYDKFIKENFHKIGNEKQGYKVWHGKYDKCIGIYSETELDVMIL